MTGSIPVGTQLGPFEITALLGAGGMGEVYRARDTRLGRTVAIKVLSAQLSSRPELRERFEREAQAISKLNHPSICTLYDVGQAPNPEPGAGRPDTIHFLVMEYLEGETLAARLQRGLLPLKEAMKIAIEIGEGLDSAHRQGIVHRDLKPGNVMLTTTGAARQSSPQAKLLDFGLAKLRMSAEASALPLAVSAMPTDVANLTAAGTVLGTLQYMAPEQLEGKEADARSDIFAFGTLMYEMFTGRKAFQGKSQVSLMAAILEHDPPPISSIQQIVPPALDHVVKECLPKDPAERWQTVSDVVKQLKWIAAEDWKPAATTEPAAPLARRERLKWAAVVGLATILAAGFAAAQFFRAPATMPLARFQVPPPAGGVFPGANNAPRMSISPDGQYLAFTVNLRDGKPDQLWIRRLDSLEARPLANTEGPQSGAEPVQQPFWSPDSRYAGFFEDGKLKKVDIASGGVQTVSSMPGNNYGGTWNRDGTILVGTSLTKGIQRVSADGGVPSPVTTLNISRKETAHLWPRFLPDGRHFLYLALGESAIEDRTVYVGSIDSNERKLVLKSEYMADFAPPGYLFFVRDGALMVQRFDVEALELQGEPMQAAETVQGALFNGRIAFAVSDTGILVYRPGSGSAAADSQLVWFDRSGKQLGTFGTPFSYRGVELSPDGLRAAVHREDREGNGDLWVLDLERGSTSRFTFDPTQHNMSPIWSPDGRRIIFSRNPGSSWALYEKDSTGVGSEQLLYESKNSGYAVPLSVSPDGRTLVFNVFDPNTLGDLWLVPLSGEHKPSPYLQPPSNQTHGQLSPDGRWMAYTSGASGRPEIYVQSFPSPGTRYQVSTAFGSQPRWRGDGKELFYLESGAAVSSGTIAGLMSVDVETAGGALRFGIPHALFDSYAFQGAHVAPVFNYAVSTDGKRFLIARQLAASNSSPAEMPLTVVLNWTSALKPR